ncbi:hypothetical protein PIB30_017429 [Stylosanthes scabra]|uniref:SecA family profile domain-containing protein n=1 Tax=Stylosanthes scabra TaxID=79078 RepID=A0ABU6X5W5_9FABA|nr:hypothetical protein [Stylosanthes scabra]
MRTKLLQICDEHFKRGRILYRRDVEYIVRDEKALIIINELLIRRVEEKQRWFGGIHRAMEGSEGLKIETARGKWKQVFREIEYMFR